MEVSRLMFFLVSIAIFMLIVLFLPIFTNFYVFSEKKRWLWSFLSTIAFIIVLIGARLLDVVLLNELVSFVLGFIGFYVPLWLVAALPVLLFKKKRLRVFVFSGVLGLSLLLSIWATVNFYGNFCVDVVDISSDKVSEDYSFLHITDTQFGTLSESDIEKVAEIVNEALEQNEVDAIFFTGDLVDTNSYSFENLKSLGFDHPKMYFSYGNHEFYHDTERLQGVIDQLGYQTLRNEGAEFNEELDVFGIDDSRDEGFVGEVLDQINVTDEKFNVLLYHRPTGVVDAQEKGVNLMVVGHSHGGQFFPYTLIAPYVFGDFAVGETSYDGFTLYHSRGAGLWGPKMRLGSYNEITLINVKAK